MESSLLHENLNVTTSNKIANSKQSESLNDSGLGRSVDEKGEIHSASTTRSESNRNLKPLDSGDCYEAKPSQSENGTSFNDSGLGCSFNSINPAETATLEDVSSCLQNSETDSLEIFSDDEISHGGDIHTSTDTSKKSTGDVLTSVSSASYEEKNETMAFGISSGTFQRLDENEQNDLFQLPRNTEDAFVSPRSKSYSENERSLVDIGPLYKDYRALHRQAQAVISNEERNTDQSSDGEKNTITFDMDCGGDNDFISDDTLDEVSNDTQDKTIQHIGKVFCGPEFEISDPQINASADHLKEENESSEEFSDHVQEKEILPVGKIFCGMEFDHRHRDACPPINTATDHLEVENGSNWSIPETSQECKSYEGATKDLYVFTNTLMDIFLFCTVYILYVFTLLCILVSVLFASLRLNGNIMEHNDQIFEKQHQDERHKRKRRRKRNIRHFDLTIQPPFYLSVYPCTRQNDFVRARNNDIIRLSAVRNLENNLRQTETHIGEVITIHHQNASARDILYNEPQRFVTINSVAVPVYVDTRYPIPCPRVHPDSIQYLNGNRLQHHHLLNYHEGMHETVNRLEIRTFDFDISLPFVMDRRYDLPCIRIDIECIRVTQGNPQQYVNNPFRSSMNFNSSTEVNRSIYANMRENRHYNGNAIHYIGREQTSTTIQRRYSEQNDAIPKTQKSFQLRATDNNLPPLDQAAVPPQFSNLSDRLRQQEYQCLVFPNTAFPQSTISVGSSARENNVPLHLKVKIENVNNKRCLRLTAESLLLMQNTESNARSGKDMHDSPSLNKCQSEQTAPENNEATYCLENDQRFGVQQQSLLDISSFNGDNFSTESDLASGVNTSHSHQNCATPSPPKQEHGMYLRSEIDSGYISQVQATGVQPSLNVQTSDYYFIRGLRGDDDQSKTDAKNNAATSDGGAREEDDVSKTRTDVK